MCCTSNQSLHLSLLLCAQTPDAKVMRDLNGEPAVRPSSLYHALHLVKKKNKTNQYLLCVENNPCSCICYFFSL